MAVPVFSIHYLSEYAVSIQMGNVISEATLQRITGFSILLREKRFTGFIDAVTAYTTLSVFYDPMQVAGATELTGKSSFEKVVNYLTTLYQELQVQPINKCRHIIIPVCYGGDFGPDLEVIATMNNLTPEEVIALHTTGQYKVFMIGFVPGFAYLGGMNEQLATPRRMIPRKTVPAGSVGIAGKQTGMYSLDTPGGWQIIGQTPLVLFDANRSQPALLQAGDEVTFTVVNAATFEQLRQEQDADSHS